MSNKRNEFLDQKIINTLIRYWPYISHIYTQKQHDYFIYLLPIQFLSVPYNLWTPHDYGQTAPVKERHI